MELRPYGELAEGLSNLGFSHKIDVKKKSYKGVSSMKKGKKKKTKKYVLTLIATVLFIAYSVWALLDGNDVGGVLGIGTALLLVVSFVYNWKVDREDEEKRQELEAKAPQIPQDLPDEVRAMKAKGQDIQAIKLVRELTGMSLYDAKNFVDNIDG